MPEHPLEREDRQLWLIEAPYYYLDQFCLQAGLDRDSAVPLVFTATIDRFADARLTWPGPKCARPEPWLQVLALLYLHRIPFRLYKARGREDRLTALTLLRPSIDEELQGILGTAARGVMEELDHYRQVLRRAFELLDRAAEEKADFSPGGSR